MTRVLDLVAGSVLLVVLSPIWLVAAVAVRLSSPGPVLYAGERVGQGGRVFRMFKFRTMQVGADRHGPAVTGKDDPRVTAAGRWLRATKVDELPQLLNVLRGDMSLVGPRPEAPRYVALYDVRQREVLRVRPGITGPTQLHFRREEQLLDGADVEDHYTAVLMPRKLEMDLSYLRERSLRRDVGILFETVRTVVTR